LRQPQYLARRGDSITLENYAQHDWLLLRHPLLNRSFWWIERDGQSLRVRQPTPRLVSDNFDFCWHACSMARAAVRAHGAPRRTWPRGNWWR
jgi:DNA-binding transcriptional LysR family regulator